MTKAIKQIGHVQRQFALSLLIVLSGTLDAVSQGVLIFANYYPYPGAVDAPIYDVDGVTPLAGPGFLAQLYAAAPGQSLQPVDIPRPFGIGTSAGYFNGNQVTIPGVSAGGTATVQVAAWRASDGPTFAAANHQGAHVGESLVFTVGPLTANLPPPAPFVIGLAGLRSFSLHVVAPEPSVFALGLLGGALLALGRRRRCTWGRVKFKPAPPSTVPASSGGSFS